MTADLRPILVRARSRHGLFRHVDAEAVGISRRQLDRMLSTGTVERVVPGVYRIGGAPMTQDQALLVAVWASGPDAMASHRSAARLWGIPGYGCATEEVTRPFGQNQRLGVGAIHVCSVLPDRHRTTVRAISVSTPARTVFELAGVVPAGKAERALDFALQRKLCTLADVRQVFFALARRGRRGTATMRALLADRGAGYVAPASELERVARRVFQDAGLPMPAFEVDLGSNEWVGRVDCLWRGAKLIVELDGALHHGSLSARRDDRIRDNRLMSAGWRVIRVTWDDLKQRPNEVVGWIRQALASVAV